MLFICSILTEYLGALSVRTDLSYALVHNLELLTHFAKRAQNERWFSSKTESRKKPRYEKYTGTMYIETDPTRRIFISHYEYSELTVHKGNAQLYRFIIEFASTSWSVNER
jgi:hypothetical protein